MLREFLARMQQGYRTTAFPAEPPTLPDRFVGRPDIDQSKCREGCSACLECCPTGALRLSENRLTMDLGRCLFCEECERSCSSGAVRFSGDYRLAVRRREDLHFTGEALRLAKSLEGKIGRVLGRSLKLRQVSAGGCNACEAELNVLGTIAFDLGRFGVQFVASPRHADGIAITGPIPDNMRLGLIKTWEAIPQPRVAIAVGACAISGGPFVGHPQVHNGSDSGQLPIDLYIPGCPPHPITILDGLLRLIGKIEAGKSWAPHAP